MSFTHHVKKRTLVFKKIGGKELAKHTYRTAKIKLHGFNNLTKSLNFNLYRVCYTQTPPQKEAFIQKMDEEYNAHRLTEILCTVAERIGADVLNIAKQDYEPQGASATLLIAEEPVQYAKKYNLPPYLLSNYTPKQEVVVAHLNKSHIAVHTYPETHPKTEVSTFRADIDVATCGVVSPLRALDYLLQAFDSDLATIDYRIRGFTRDQMGQKHYIDHTISSIQDFICPDIKNKYEFTDSNLIEENLFHTKLVIKDLALPQHTISTELEVLSSEEEKRMNLCLQKELNEIVKVH
ncbi:MAG: adenosylmethionine decarboxylase [Gammaproteobacteria bacterium]|nr:adenosylmethionine decarboxylase [Gammaproteobacteria bacterium]